jgi:hypothetical protein
MINPFDGAVTGNVPMTPEGMALRQRLALAMMGGTKRGYPKNVGEGLTAIGDSLGEIGMSRRLEEQMAALERNSANRGVRPAALPAAVPAVPGSNDPATGAQSAAPAAVQTASAAPAWLTGAAALPASEGFPDVAPAATADASPQLPPPPPPVQDASVTPPQQDLSYPQTAANIPSDIVSDVPDPGVQRASLPPPDPNIRARIAGTLQARQGVPQQNPMLAGQSPASMPSTFNPDDLGSPLNLNNRPIPTDIQPVQVAGDNYQRGPADYQRGTLKEVPVGIKPSGAPSEPVPEAPKQPRTEEMPYRPPTFEKPPRMADPGPQELDYIEAANDPSVLGSYQKQYAAQAALMAQKRKDDHDQAMKAYESRDIQTRAAQERASKDAETKLNLQKLEDERAKRQYEETIIRHLGGRNPALIEENLYKSRASVANVPAITQSVARARAVLDKMYTGPTADVNTFLSQLLPSFPGGFDPARGSATQQFKTAMGNVMSAARAAVVGSGAQSDKELATLQKTTAADAKLDKDTIKEALDAAERLMVKTAIAHQEQVHNYAGNFDPDRTRSVFGSFGVPGMIDVVPQPTINKLMQHSTNEQALKDFDETYHTPGLAQKLIERETLRRGRPR